MKNSWNWQFRHYHLVLCRMLVVASLVFACTASTAIAQTPPGTQSGNEGNGQFWQYVDSGDSANLLKSVSEGGDCLDMTAEEEELSSNQDLLLGPGRWIYNTRIGKNLAKHQNVDIRRRPMMYWRRFADRPVPPRGTFLFFIFFNSLICLAFKKRVEVASSCVRKSFWKSLFVGFIFVILMGIAARFCFDSALFTPAALLILGIGQLLVLAGLAVSSMTVGTAILNKLGVTTMSVSQTENADQPARSFVEKLKFNLHYLAPVIFSSVLVTLISLIPTLGFLPRMGTRFVMWFCVLGLGALIRTKLGRKPL